MDDDHLDWDGGDLFEDDDNPLSSFIPPIEARHRFNTSQQLIVGISDWRRRLPDQWPTQGGMYNHAERTLVMHVFIQWMAKKRCLNAWLCEMTRERDGYTIDTRFDRLMSCTYNDIVYSSFGHSKAWRGVSYWSKISDQWVPVAQETVKFLRAGRTQLNDEERR